MKKIVICMSLVCVVSMHASEKKNQKKDLNLEQLRSALRKEREEHQKNHGADYIRGLEVKRNNKIQSEKSVTEEKK